MGDLIKIVGVQYAVNSNHVKGEDMTAQEQQKTIEFLTMLDRKHPYVSVKPEPTNETDEEAFVARVASRKAGYVRNREEYKSLAQAALTTSGRGYFRARVKEVIISAEGYFFVEAETDSTPKEGIENVIKAMEAKKGDKMRYMANELEHLLSGLCNEGRQKKLRKSWLPHLLSTHEAERAWHDWLHLKGADCHKPDNLKMMSWLEDIETELSNIPALAPYSNDDKIAMLIRAHYTRIPLDKYRQLLTAFVIRDRLRMRLGLPTNSFAPTPSLTSQEEDYLIDKIIKYSQTLVRREDVEVLQRFIYHEISYLPPEYKLRVDNMTERFLSEEAREGIQINAIKEQTKALKEVAKKPTIQAEHYHAGNSTFDVHSKHLHLDHQEEGNSALLPSEL